MRYGADTGYLYLRGAIPLALAISESKAVAFTAPDA
jgi:hypothetical protein